MSLPNQQRPQAHGPNPPTVARTRVAGAADLALTGIALALWTGAGHLAAVGLTRALRSDMYWPWSSRDVIWMVPLGYVLLFALPVGLLTLLHLITPRVARRNWAFGIWAGLGLLAVMLLYARAHSWTLALLAAGAGVQLAALYRDREAALTRVIRRGALAFALTFAAVGGGGALWRSWSERRALATLPPAGPATPNVLLLILDTVRASSMSLYGSPRPTTPRLAAWATRGVTFEQAFATSSWTLPSHASMFTGFYAGQQSGDRAARFDATHRTLAEEFRSRGYATGGFIGNQVYTGYETGLARGFVTYHDTQRSLAEVLLNTTFSQSGSFQKALEIWQRDHWLGGAVRGLARSDLRPAATVVAHQHKNAAAVIAPFLRWQSSLGDRSFFAFLNFFDAHEPQRTPEPYRTMFNGGRTRRDTYDGTLRYLDDQIGDLLADLERRGVLRHTIVIITSDHGEHFGEHGLFFHGNSLYRELLRVPLLLLTGDATTAGRRIAAQVSLRDLAATILDLAHVGEDAALPGYSLAHYRDAQPTLKSPVVAEVSRSIRGDPKDPTAKGDMVAVVDDSLHLIRQGDGTLLAYAYRSDSTEQHNLAVGPALPALVALFSELYAAALRYDHKP